MDFGLTDEQVLLLDSLQELLDRECPESYIAELDRTHQAPTSFRLVLHEAGFASLGFPEEYGGTPCDAVTLMMLTERVSQQGLNNGYGIELLQAMDILEFGSQEQKADILGLLAAGAVPFNGTKTLITNALDAKYLLVMAKSSDGDDERTAISMYLVPMDAPGVSTNKLEKIVWNTNDSCVFQTIFSSLFVETPGASIGTRYIEMAVRSSSPSELLAITSSCLLYTSPSP